MESFNERLKKAMLAKGKRAVDISAGCDINRGAVSNWLSGKRLPKRENIIKMADYLGVSRMYLLGLSNEMQMVDNNGDFKDLFSSTEQKSIINDILSICLKVDLETLKTIANVVKAFDK